MTPVEKFHFIGIGGVGMSMVAQVLQQHDAVVTGCDQRSSGITRRLTRFGIPVAAGHDSRHLNPGDRVVVSSAVPEDLPEIQAARDMGLTILHRSEALGLLSDHYQTIAVTGSHGKTTTTSLLGLMLEEDGKDPTVMVGAEVPQFNGNVRLGDSPWLVTEADESDGSMINIGADHVVLTNLDDDHLDHYGTTDRLVEVMGEYLRSVPSGGTVVANTDSELVRKVLAVSSPRCNVVTTGFNGRPDYRAIETVGDGGAIRGFRFESMDQPVWMSRPGRHQAANALTAFVAGLQLDISESAMRRALTGFHGVKRRFEYLSAGGSITVVDDYAHHPQEVKATIETARALAPERLLVVFQPHRYTRVQHLYQDYAPVFNGADHLIVTPIYAAGEPPVDGVNSQLITRQIASHPNAPRVETVSDLDAAIERLTELLEPKDWLLVMGAGDVRRVGETISQSQLYDRSEGWGESDD